ncbi:MAG: Stp1/IreP family PP2C-type Ser/Thr phosphatase [Lachnospiraceae bacterium]|nr:Stp1/IreP family PP2C-type Ser/Thr phosphatase [Lachnospiraceae bacterium]
MDFYALTDIGKVRQCNEDYLFASDKPVGPLPNLYIVADGMGGANAGEYASEYTVRSVVEMIQSSTLAPGLSEKEAVEEAIRDAIGVTNWQIHDISRREEDKAGMGTTLVLATVLEDIVIIANVGDSRGYSFYDGLLSQVTLDHSYVEELVRRGEMTPEEARVSRFKNRITRAIGAEPSVRIDFFGVTKEPGSKIILCTDGLTNMLSDEEMADILGREADTKTAVEQLLEGAINAGGTDNITVLCISI